MRKEVAGQMDAILAPPPPKKRKTAARTAAKQPVAAIN
jgi:hypothetical protein